MLKIFSKFTGEHPCQCVISIKLLCISCKFAEYFQNTFTYKHLWRAAFVSYHFWTNTFCSNKYLQLRHQSLTSWLQKDVIWEKVPLSQNNWCYGSPFFYILHYSIRKRMKGLTLCKIFLNISLQMLCWIWNFHNLQWDISWNYDESFIK